jgi:hypothetical protein
VASQHAVDATPRVIRTTCACSPTNDGDPRWSDGARSRAVRIAKGWCRVPVETILSPLETEELRMLPPPCAISGRENAKNLGN